MRLLQSNVFWSGLEASTSAGLSFVSAFVVARIVGPSEVGIGAAAVAMHVLLWVVVNALFADALVQKLTVSDDEVSSGLWASTIVGALGTVIEIATAFPIAASLQDARILPMSFVLAAALPLVGAGGAMQGLLTRGRAYRVLAGRALIGQGSGVLLGVALAFAGAGAWAIVIQQLATSLVGALSLILRTDFRPRFVLRWRDVRALLDVGLPLVLNTLVQHSRYRLFALLIGGTAGAAALGQVHMAFRLVDTVRELVSTAMWRLFLPSMSERQEDLTALRAAVARSLDLSGLFLFPAFGAMAVVIHPLVRVLLGPVWQPSADAAIPLVAITIYNFFYFPAGVALVARGITRVTVIAQVAMTALTLAAVLVIRPANPMAAALVWAVTQMTVFPILHWRTAKLLGDTLGEQMRAGLPALMLATAAVGAAMLVPAGAAEAGHPVAIIAVRLMVGAAIYLPGALLLLRTSVLAALNTVGWQRRPA
jgi:PST family polysaccharide transporter